MSFYLGAAQRTQSLFCNESNENIFLRYTLNSKETDSCPCTREQVVEQRLCEATQTPPRDFFLFCQFHITCSSDTILFYSLFVLLIAKSRIQGTLPRLASTALFKKKIRMTLRKIGRLKTWLVVFLSNGICLMRRVDCKPPLYSSKRACYFPNCSKRTYFMRVWGSIAKKITKSGVQ